MAEPEGLSKRELTDLITRLGDKLNFEVRTEVQASESAWVDVVWFDSRLPVSKKSFNMRYAPVLPVIGFEIEWGTGLNAKHVKGSVSNLSNLGAQLSVIVIAQHNLASLQKLPPHTGQESDELEKILSDRVYRWVYAEAQARGRVIVMFEREVIDWAKTKGVMPNASAFGVTQSELVPA